MLETMKKTMSFGLGAAMLTKDKIMQFVDDAVARGEMSSEEGKRFVDDVTNRAEEEKQNLQTWVREQVAKVIREVGCAEASKVEALEHRIAALEARLAEPAGSSGPEVGEIE